MTGNQIGDEGANAISELLKTNTSLNDLNVGSLEEIEKESGKKKTRHTRKWEWTDCGIGEEGKKSIRTAWGERKGKLWGF